MAKRITDPPRAFELLALLCVTLFLGQRDSAPIVNQKAFAQDQAAQGYLRSHFSPGTRVLSYYTGDMVRAGLQTPITNLYHYYQLVRKGTLNDADMVTQLERHYFGIVVLDFDLLTEKRRDFFLDFYLTKGIRHAIQANYQMATTVEMPGPERLYGKEWFYVWVPRPKAQAALPDPRQVSSRARGH